MTAVVVDASVWVSRLIPADAHHAVSCRWLEQRALAGEPLVSPVLVLSEIAGAIARRVGKPEIARHALAGILRIPTLRLVDINKQLAQSAAYLAADYKLRGADAIYVALAKELNLPLVSLDVEQRERVNTIVATLAPAVNDRETPTIP
jgi:predicted nucleic acid-binding protein